MRALVLGLTVIMLGACAKEEQAEKETPEMDAESALKELRGGIECGKRYGASRKSSYFR